MSTNRNLEPGDKVFAGFIAVAMTVFGLLAILMFISLEVALWGAGITNGLVWHSIVLFIAWVSSFVYKWVIRKGNWL